MTDTSGSITICIQSTANETQIIS